MSETNFTDMFNLDAETFSEKTTDSVMYKVVPSGGKNGVYSALVRFIPWHVDPKNSLVDKWESWLENPLTKKGMNVDCPSSIGKQSDLMDIYWKLKKSPNKAMQDKAAYFSRRRKFYSIVQILKDENNPELEGKLKIFKFGIKIFDKIQAELKPEYGTPHVPFHPFEGKPFHIKCKEVAGYPNYDESKFLDKPAPININGKLAQPGDEKEVIEFLKANSPNLDDFKFREWTPEAQKHFQEMISIILPNVSETVENVIKNKVETATATVNVPENQTSNIQENDKSEISDEKKAPLSYDFDID